MAIKILHVITGLDVGGAEKMLAKLLHSIQRSRFEVRVVSLKSQGVLAAEIRDMGIEVDELGMTGISSSVWGILKLRKIVRRWKPNIVHAWMYHANIVSFFALLGQRVPLLWGIRYSIGDLGDLKFFTRLVIDLGRVFSKKVAGILYNAKSIAEQHGKYGYSSERSHFIPNGIDLDNWTNNSFPSGFLRKRLGIAVNDPIVGMVARFDPQKDFESFLMAAHETLKLRSNLHFVLVGPGVVNDQKHLTQMIKDNALERAVYLMGEQKDVRPYLRDFDLFTLSSKNGEAFPNVLIEAMAMCVPVVATDVGDCRSIVGEAGLIVPPHSPRALGEAWIKILSLSPADRVALGRRGQERVAKYFSIESVTKTYQNLYEQILK